MPPPSIEIPILPLNQLGSKMPFIYYTRIAIQPLVGKSVLPLYLICSGWSVKHTNKFLFFLHMRNRKQTSTIYISELSSQVLRGSRYGNSTVTISIVKSPSERHLERRQSYRMQKPSRRIHRYILRPGISTTAILSFKLEPFTHLLSYIP